MSEPNPQPTPEQLDAIEATVPEMLLIDRREARRLLRNIRNALKSGKPCDRNFDRLTKLVEKSAKSVERKRAALPHVTYPDDLPVAQRVDEIRSAIERHQVVIVSGETGSGKSTQLPKLCLDMGRGVHGLIGHTQPRRIAARSVAARVADELGTPLGKTVGFKVRFTDETGPETAIKLMTDGILLAESQRDTLFEAYDTLIIDEAHERSLNIDFLLGLVKRLLPKRPDFKLIITSATIDAERFSEHFDCGAGPAPIISVSGRSYPVELRYRPLSDPEEETEVDVERGICEAVSEIASGCGPEGTSRGDILVFLPTERDIREVAKVLRGWSIPGDSSQKQTEILPLYGRLSAGDQQKVFRTSAHRRIVLATNVAESSLTVPGIRSVIDTGTARISRYSAHSKVQRLPIEPVSRASADQRKGRCGRVGPGLCIRLYAEDDYEKREEFTIPEIQRTNLANVILQTHAFKLGRLDDFPFLDPPKPAAIRDGYKTLFELGALDAHNELTAIGRQLAKLPVDPRIGRMVLAAAEGNCLRDVLIIAAALEVQDPRDRPIEKQQAADEAHAKFVHEGSDFIGYLKIWDFVQEQQDKLSRGQFRKACKQNFLSFNRLREWQDVHRQLRTLAQDSGLKPDDRRVQFTTRGELVAPPEHDANAEQAVHLALLTGLLANLAFRSERFEYTGAGGKKLQLWPGSGCFSQKPKWIVAAELVETSRRFARTVAKIDPDVIEPLAEHLTKRSYSDPYWSKKSGSAMVYESVTLFGLPIVSKRPVRYGKLNPEDAREMFIRHALVEGEWESDAKFSQHNAQLEAELDALAARTRRPDLFLGEDAKFDFFDERLPPEVTDAHALRRWRRKAEQKTPHILFMEKRHLWKTEDEQQSAADFPAELVAGSVRLPLEYHLEPGADEDGVTVLVPQEAVNQIEPRRLGWLVPGLLTEKVEALIRSLPKSLRRQFVPAPETARQVASRLTFDQGEILEVVSRELSRVGNERVTADDFDLERMPNHLRMNVRIVGKEGETLKSGRNLTALRQELAGRAKETFADLATTTWHEDNLREWSFGTMPAVVDLERHGITLKGYPAVVDAGQSVALRLFDSQSTADAATRKGLRRLFLLKHRKAAETQVNHLPGLERMKVVATTLGGYRQFVDQASELLADRACFGNNPALPKTEAEWNTFQKTARSRLGVAAQDVCVVLSPVIERVHQTRQLLDQKFPEAWTPSVSDMRAQFKHLIAGRFLVDTPWEWLHQYPRYLQAIGVRLQKLKEGRLVKDRELLAEIHPLWRRYVDHRTRLDELSLTDARLDYYRWMLEEYRVSLFAQTLRTAISVSPQKLAKQWAKVSPIEAGRRT